MVTSEGLHSKGARQRRPGKGKRWNSLGFSFRRVAVPTRVTYTLAGGRHFTFSSWDNTEEKADWRKKRGKICKRRNLQEKCIAREILESSICDPIINRLSFARSKLSTLSVKQDTRCVQRRQEGSRELTTELYVQLQVQARHIKNIKKREFETSILQSRPHWIAVLMRKVTEKVKRKQYIWSNLCQRT